MAAAKAASRANPAATSKTDPHHNSLTARRISIAPTIQPLRPQRRRGEPNANSAGAAANSKA